MFKFAIALAVSLLASSQVFASDFCAFKDAKLADTCDIVWKTTIAKRTHVIASHKDMVKADLMTEYCGGTGSIFRGGQGTTDATFNAIRSKLKRRGYKVDDNELSRLEYLFMNYRNDLPTMIKLNEEFSSPIKASNSCSSGYLLMVALYTKVVL